MKADEVTVPIVADLSAVVEQLKALRLCCSQIGFALDGAILALDPEPPA